MRVTSTTPSRWRSPRPRPAARARLRLAGDHRRQQHQRYSGSIPLGSLFAIPKDVDLTKIGITTSEGMALAKAYRELRRLRPRHVRPEHDAARLPRAGRQPEPGRQPVQGHERGSARTSSWSRTTPPRPRPAAAGPPVTGTTTTTAPAPTTTAPRRRRRRRPPPRRPAARAQRASASAAAPDQLLLKISQDALGGDAKYTISVDGKQIGGVQTAHALHGSGQSDLISVRGDWAQGNHDVGVNFINDVWAGQGRGGATQPLRRQRHLSRPGRGGRPSQPDDTTGAQHFTFHDYLV